MRISTRLLPGLAILVVLGAACHEASTKPRLQSPLVGVWELTTHFDTFTFETPAPSPPDCPYSTQYCVHYSGTTEGAYIGGLLEVRDTSSSTDTLGRTLVVTGTLQSSFCDTIEKYPPTGCTHVSDLAPVQYTGSMQVASDGATAGSIGFGIAEPSLGSWPNPLVLFSALPGRLRYAGDSIYGPVYWGTMQGRSPPSYRGTMVLRRVH